MADSSMLFRNPARQLLLICSMLACRCFAAVEINQATEAELDSVKGLGPSTTARILKERSSGPFKDWPDFMRRVKGFKPHTAAKLSDNGLTVGDKPYTSPQP
jgi:competence protein ComEA